MTEHASTLPGDLVSAAWLGEHLLVPNLQVVDIRGYVRSESLGGGRQRATYAGARDEYEEGHVPGAVFIDWTVDIVDPEHPVKAQIAGPDRFADAMGAIGIGNDTDVVVVDHAGGHFATRLWWALRFYGHDRVAVLNGGFNAWKTGGFPLQTGWHAAERRTFVPHTRPELVSDADDVANLLVNRQRQLIDARDADTFSGIVQRGSRGGHIPGALNLPAGAMMQPDGGWKSTEEIREAARAAGVDPGAPVTAYCNGGVTATAVLFGLHRAGLADISNYDGSWNEWGERPDLPVEDNRDLWSQGNANLDGPSKSD